MLDASKIKFPKTKMIHEDNINQDLDSLLWANKFFRIALNPYCTKSLWMVWYGIFADDLEDALEKLGAWADDHAKGLIVDCSQMSEEELKNGSYHFVNGSLDCALDLTECMSWMVEEYTFNLRFDKTS